MDQTGKIIQLENKVKALEAQIDFINKRFGLVPDEKELHSAVEAIIESRDISKLENYIKRGGQIVTPAKSEARV
jgi:hypothetical protein